MGLLYNHLATLICGIFTGVLILLWHLFLNYILGGMAVLNIVFIMAVPVMIFLTIVCFVSQRSADYMHGHEPSNKPTKKLVYTSGGSISG